MTSRQSSNHLHQRLHDNLDGLQAEVHRYPGSQGGDQFPELLADGRGEEGEGVGDDHDPPGEEQEKGRAVLARQRDWGSRYRRGDHSGAQVNIVPGNLLPQVRVCN